MRLRAVAVAGLVALALGGVTGCSQAERFVDDQSLQDAERDSDGQVSDSGEVAATDVRKGDCVVWGNQAMAETVVEVDVVPCDQPHDEEAYYWLELPAGEYPGDEAVAAQADKECMGQFEAFVGLAYDKSTLVTSYLYPGQENWEIGERALVCFVGQEPPQQTTGTLRAAQR